MKVLCPDGLHRDLDEDSLCPNAFRRDGKDPCLGHLEVSRQGQCQCLAVLRPPCSSCESMRLRCPECDWELKP